MTVRRVLVPTDFSESADVALAHALRLADRFDASLHLLHVVSELNAAFYGLADTEDRAAAGLEAQIRSEAQERLSEIAPDRSSSDVQSTVVQRPNLDETDAVLEYVTEHAVDLVVMGTHGRRGISRLMLGSVSNKVIRRAPCPVLTVQAGEETVGASDAVRYQNILAPVDFSEHSRRSLRLSKEIAARSGAHLHLMFVAEKQVVPTFSDTGLPGINVVEMDPEIVENAQDALEELNEEVGGPDVESSCHVETGSVVENIIEFADAKEVDLIAMATRGLTNITRFVLGTNTERTVRAAPCPVLTVPASSAPDDE
ncbi:MAG: universal stress protein [Salinibacter sp.]